MGGVRWTQERITEAFLRFEAEHGRRPQAVDVEGRYNRVKYGLSPHRDHYMPQIATVRKRFGSFSNAMVHVYGEAPLVSNNKDEQTAEIVRRLRADPSLTIVDVARELGISGQALGRRIERWMKVYEPGSSKGRTPRPIRGNAGSTPAPGPENGKVAN